MADPVAEERLATLESAASLQRQRQQFLAANNIRAACPQDWDDEKGQVFDTIAQDALEPDDIVVLSDLHCYSRAGLREWVHYSRNRFPRARPRLPLGQTEITDADLALLQVSDATQADYDRVAREHDNDELFATLGAVSEREALDFLWQNIIVGNWNNVETVLRARPNMQIDSAFLEMLTNRGRVDYETLKRFIRLYYQVSPNSPKLPVSTIAKLYTTSRDQRARVLNDLREETSFAWNLLDGTELYAGVLGRRGLFEELQKLLFVFGEKLNDEEQFRRIATSVTRNYLAAYNLSGVDEVFVEQDNELFDVLTESIALRLRSQQQAPLQPEVSLQHTLRLLSLLDEYGSLLRRMRNDPNEDRWDDYVDILKDAAYYDLETNLMNENWPSVETILRRPRQLGTIFDEYDMYRLVKLPRISNNSLERVVQLYHRFQPKYKMSLEIPANLSYHDRNDPQNEIWALTDLYNNNLGVWNTRETQGIREYAWALGSHELLDQMKRLLADISAEKPDFPMLIDEYIKFLPSARSAEEIERVKNELLSFANSLSGEQVSDNVQTTNRDGAPSLRDRSDRQAARTERAQARNPY